ncbi:T9SS type A sorting domain-containing protein [Candidatus Cloacimonadota bacterium]
MIIYPNPFNPVATISFSINDNNFAEAELTIYNIKGQMIRHFSISNEQSSIIWDGMGADHQPVSSGIYYCRLVNGDTTATKKLVLIK